MRRLMKILTSRFLIVTLLIALQVWWFVQMLLRLSAYSPWISAAMRVLSFLVIIHIMNLGKNPAFKLAWISLILIFPLLGGLLYLFLGTRRPARSMRKKLQPRLDECSDYLKNDRKLTGKIWKEDQATAGQIYYLENYSGFPAYENTASTYYRSGEEAFPAIIEALKKAEDYIFLEYFIIEEGVFWNTILDVLVERASQGVDVRVIYDDVGCGLILPSHYDRKLQEMGIHCIVFNKYIPIFSAVFNNRDHRKILVIDGKTAFTGGINFADEYINEKQRFGYWKDNCLKIEGDAVRNMTLMFLSMWNAFAKETLPYEKYVRRLEDIQETKSKPEEGIVLPYSDHPLDEELVGESVYLNMINHASRYIYFFTPYLIIDNEMATALILAAKRGVEVRIITPGIPDKPLIYLVTQSYYRQLVEGGVRIFQYRPGFVHGKVAVSDDLVATVGTINLDYRSLYLHFENGVYLYRCPSVLDIRNDILTALSECTEITKSMCQRNLVIECFQGIARIFAPML